MNLVIDKMVEIKETSRVELARITTLNKATISSIIKELIDKHIVVELDKKIKTSGRSANAIILNKNAGRILSMDLQTHRIHGVVTNLFGEVLFEIRKPISNPDFSPYLKVLLQTIDELKHNTYDSTYGIIGIGIGVYGILSETKKIVFAPFSSWKDIELKKIVEEYSGLPTYVENEANISALGENRIYSNQENLIALNIGLGVGMGIIIKDHLYTGQDGFAGEIGHTIIVPNGKKCVCGNHGCVERYISDVALEEQYFERSNEQITIDEFIVRLKAKDPIAEGIYDEFIKYMAITINNISQILNPETIIINSKVIENIPESISEIKNRLRSQIMTLHLLTTSTYKSKTNLLGLTYVLSKDFFRVKEED